MGTILIRLGVVLALLGAVPAIWSAPVTADDEFITISAASITYTTRAGDTLSSIAHRLTEKRENWVAIAKLNRISADTNVPVGTGIVIPAEMLQDDPVEAKVVALSGTITFTTSSGAAAPIKLGTTIIEGMQIDTGHNSFLTLLLPNRTRVTLPSNSRIKLSKLRLSRYTKSPRTEIMLLRGGIESRVSPLEHNKGRFEVHSPLSVAGVRGTHFRVNVVGTAIATEVLSGTVDVAQRGKPVALSLRQGQGNIINAKSVGKAINLLPPPQLTANPSTLDQSWAQFTLAPVANANAYRLQVSTDKEALNILAENRSSTTRLKIDGMPSGDYFAQISAIDKLGLEGPARAQAFTWKPIGEPSSNKNRPSAPFVDRGDEKKLLLKWVAAPDQKFKLQVARDAGFTWLIFNVDTSKTEALLPRPAFGTYYARVQTINPDGSANPFSLAQAFIVTDQWIMNDGSPVSVKENQLNSKR